MKYIDINEELRRSSKGTNTLPREKECFPHQKSIIRHVKLAKQKA